MQYPVPQFTDVEDKVIGPLTIKQFGIIFGGGALVFVVYSTTKSLLGLIVAVVLIGIPALGLAFAKFNGRPVYSSFGNLINFFLQPRQMLFHKEGVDPSAKIIDSTLEIKGKNQAGPDDAKTQVKKLKELNYQLQKQAHEEAELSRQIKK
jgi:hypothetical protein